jgi:hypothetical protein
MPAGHADAASNDEALCFKNRRRFNPWGIMENLLEGAFYTILVRFHFPLTWAIAERESKVDAIV